MAGKRRKKYSTGEGSRYITRNHALRKLQLSLKAFRKLCILKGVYPREPRNRKRAQKGSTGIRTLYLLKDIQFLMQERVIWTLRDCKVFARKMGKAKTLRDSQTIRRLLENRPHMTLDHIVKERYPSFIDALRDLDDCLSLIFLFSTFPSLKHVPPFQSQFCRRLSIEFLHAVIAAKALRKVFISIKGYYFQVELKGQTITWIVPHHFSFVPHSVQEVDFKIMSTFVEFYTIMLGFVNYRLYHSLNLHYPPSLPASSADVEEKMLADEQVFVAERVASLNIPLLCTNSDQPEEDVEIDQFLLDEDPKKLEEAKKEQEKIKKLKTLFKGLKFFLNREVPREPLVFIIRCLGGEVSWDKSLFVGATFDESDETVTHQIVDRPILDTQYISRYYVQPQWLFDCVNARELLPVEQYFIGAVLPPHLSPFIDKTRERYTPPEEIYLQNPSAINTTQEQSDKDEDEDDFESEEEIEKVHNKPQKSNQHNEELEEVDEDKDEELKRLRERRKHMAVSVGIVSRDDPNEKKKQAYEHRKLRESMIKNKHRRLYKSMIKGRTNRRKEFWLLEKKRRTIDKAEREKKMMLKKREKVKKLKESFGQ